MSSKRKRNDVDVDTEATAESEEKKAKPTELDRQLAVLAKLTLCDLQEVMKFAQKRVAIMAGMQAMQARLAEELRSPPAEGAVKHAFAAMLRDAVVDDYITALPGDADYEVGTVTRHALITNGGSLAPAQPRRLH